MMAKKKAFFFILEPISEKLSLLLFRMLSFLDNHRKKSLIIISSFY